MTWNFDLNPGPAEITKMAKPLGFNPGVLIEVRPGLLNTELDVCSKNKTSRRWPRCQAVKRRYTQTEL